jgi:hypothetical protein
MRSFPRSSTEFDCRDEYSDIWAGGFTFKTVALTFIIIVLTFSIEAAVHSDVNATSKKKKKTQSAQDEQPRSESPASGASPSSEESNATKDTTKGKSSWCNPNPSPTIRANRLALATILIIPLCVAFGFRIADTAPPDVRYECREILKSSMQPTWGAIIPLNIVPFIIASVAWMRAFVDCLLVRWGKTLQCINNVEGSGIGWPPFAPLFWGLVMVCLPIMGIWELVKKGAVWMMGSPDTAESATEDIELGGEERVRLVDDVDEAVVDEGEEPPAYDANWRENETRIKASQ